MRSTISDDNAAAIVSFVSVVAGSLGSLRLYKSNKRSEIHTVIIINNEAHPLCVFIHTTWESDDRQYVQAL